MNLKFEISDFKSATAARSAFLGRALARAWWYLRQISGDAAYENYLRRHRAGAHTCDALSREEFYLDALRRRYTGVSRCC